MGLHISHDAWNLPYGVYTEWRNILAEVSGIGTIIGPEYRDRPRPDIWRRPDLDYSQFTEENWMGVWETPPDDPILHVLVHHDDRGKIDRKYLKALVDRLVPLSHHIEDDISPYYGGKWRQRTDKFIQGAGEARAARHHLLYR